MAQDSEVATAKEGVDASDQQPSSPTGSNSSREETRVTREQLKKTSIAGLSQTSAVQERNISNTSELLPVDATIDTTNGIRGRPAKKRSFEDLSKDDADADADNATAQPPLPKSGHHKRMRSRDINSGDHSAYVKSEAERAETLHEESDIDAQTAPGGPAVLVDAPSREEMEAAVTQPATEQISATKNEIPASSESVTKIPPTSGFANASTASPFGSASPNKSKPAEAPQTTSSSAFASSGLSAFAASDKSPFGAAAGGKSPLGGGFGTPVSGGFGSAMSGLGSSGFGSAKPSGFGGGASTFGQPRSFAGGSSAFGAPKPFASSSAFGGDGSAFAKGKPFTSAKKDDEDDEEAQEEGEEESSSNAKDDDHEQDPRFHEQQIDTGEDGEDTAFSARARIYIFDTAWKERGTGTFKVNVRSNDDQTTSEVDPESQTTRTRRKARLLMRADATHRVILNSPIFKGMQFGAYGNTAPTGKTMTLQCQEDGKVVLLQIKIGKEDVLRKLYDLLKELEDET